MKPTTKALLFNFICFAALYLLMFFLIVTFTQLDGWMKPVTAAVAASLLAPKFQSVKTSAGEKVFMKWIFIKGVKEIK
ncbi:MAG: hypothetical protein CFE23_11490 [Flavobacterium sp. BFFFF1]|uniref:hypothetical protein n=1 Tax=unclassified Flavobacterium TaxID=196869 RepID=UPI000BC6B7A0|nr:MULTISPECIES: hypothetical protein [unclassified Flavobacterium]OYU80003.1 MAG: hypothetical protein CFE23_11490 [Flavobacterium sp. BFFFF1]